MNTDEYPPFDGREVKERAVGMAHTFLHKDREGYDLITDDFPGGCAGAVVAMSDLSIDILKMWAEERGDSPDERLQAVAAARLTD